MEMVVLLPKSPLPTKGRIGPKRWQNWFRATKKAAELSREHGIPIFISSSFKSDIYEVDFYIGLLKEMGVPTNMIIHHYEGSGTISQLREAVKSHKSCVLIETFLHSFRVKMECKSQGFNVEHEVVCGIPRPKEAVSDIILTFIYPIILVFGLKNWFENKTEIRRASGIV